MRDEAIDWPALWRLAEATFALDPMSLHGPPHWRSVERNAIELAAATPGADATLARLFAVLHDARRRNDSYDPGHGPRAAAWAAELRGVHFALDDARLATLSIALADHDRGRTSDDPTVGVCWDADRLDLTRCGMVPDPAYFSTAEGRRRAGGLAGASHRSRS